MPKGKNEGKTGYLRRYARRRPKPGKPRRTRPWDHHVRKTREAARDARL